MRALRVRPHHGLCRGGGEPHNPDAYPKHARIQSLGTGASFRVWDFHPDSLSFQPAVSFNMVQNPGFKPPFTRVPLNIPGIPNTNSHGAFKPVLTSLEPDFLVLIHPPLSIPKAPISDSQHWRLSQPAELQAVASRHRFPIPTPLFVCLFALTQGLL